MAEGSFKRFRMSLKATKCYIPLKTFKGIQRWDHCIQSPSRAFKAIRVTFKGVQIPSKAFKGSSNAGCLHSKISKDLQRPSKVSRLQSKAFKGHSKGIQREFKGSVLAFKDIWRPSKTFKGITVAFKGIQRSSKVFKGSSKAGCLHSKIFKIIQRHLKVSRRLHSKAFKDLQRLSMAFKGNSKVIMIAFKGHSKVFKGTVLVFQAIFKVLKITAAAFEGL